MTERFRYQNSARGYDNLTADRANVSKLLADDFQATSITTEDLDVTGTATINNLIVTGTLDLPDGSLDIVTRGAGVPLTALPEAGALTSEQFFLRTVTAGTDISFVTTNDNITINSVAGAGVSLSSAGGNSIVTDGVGPALAVKGTANSSLLVDTSNATTSRFDNDCIRVTDSAGTLPPGTGVSPASAAGLSASAFGAGATASADGTTAVGQNATASADNATAIGRDSAASATSALAVGRNADASQAGASALGQGSLASGSNSTALGRDSVASGAQSSAVGRNATASGDSSTAAGANATASAAQSTAVGIDSAASGTSSTALGNETVSSATGAFAAGHQAQATAARSMCIATSASAGPYVNNKSESIAIGFTDGAAANHTLIACSDVADLDSLGLGVIRGRLVHGMQHRLTDISADPVTLSANRIFQAYHRTVAGAGTVRLPTAAALLAANDANLIWWAENLGANFYLRNNTGGPITLEPTPLDTSVAIIDNTNAAVASLVLTDGLMHFFRVLYNTALAPPAQFVFCYMGKWTSG